ncbi:MAG: XkdX family protein [Clostridia bacterium]|nr:XkdX family protein [Clostridia bacterium]
MEHGAKFYKVKNYYDRGLWDETRVANAVLKGWITVDEYEEIVGKKYEEV